MLRFNLKAKTAKRLALPGPFESASGALANLRPNYQLLADGGIGVTVGDHDKRGRNIYQVHKYLPDGTPDSAFGDDGVLFVARDAFIANRLNPIDQVFLDSNGRFMFLGTGRYAGLQSNMTMRRV